jgi:apolipoprotein N-acyltransferase
MQSSPLTQISADAIALSAERGWLENLSMAEKLPMALAFGCLLGLSSAAFDMTFLAWIALAPLLVLLRAASSRTEAAWTGLIFGLGYHLVGLSCCLGLYPLRWLGMPDLLAMQTCALIWLVESLHQAILFSAFALLIYCLPVRSGFVAFYKRPYIPYLLCVPIVWMFFQWTIGTAEWFKALPINQLAYSQHANLPLIQLARYGGSGLVDMLIVLCNAALAQLVLDCTNLAPALGQRVDQFSKVIGSTLDCVLVALLLTVVNIGGGAETADVAYASRTDSVDNFYDQTPTVPVGIIQGNVSIEEERMKTSSSAEIAKRYSQLATNIGVNLLIYPEGVLNSQQSEHRLLLDGMQNLVQREKKEIIVGSIESLNDGRINGARLLSFLPTKEVLYAKQRLVPFCEFAPLGIWGQDVAKIYSGPERFLQGNQTHFLQTMWGKVGVSICNEIIYPHLISTEVRRGASLLVNIANLGWFHSSSLNRQMLAAAVFRAVENGRYVVIASNTGISAVIDPSGMVKSQSIPGKRGVILDTVQFLYKPTPFSRMWWL